MVILREEKGEEKGEEEGVGKGEEEAKGIPKVSLKLSLVLYNERHTYPEITFR